MGADLCIMALDWKQKTKNESMEKGFLRTCKEIDGRIRKIKKLPTPETMMDINNNWGPNPEGPDGSMMDEHDEPINVEMYQAYLHSLVEDLRRCYGGRDSTVIMVGGHFVFITGGMTWGDSPGDTFDVLVKLNYAGVL